MFGITVRDSVGTWILVFVLTIWITVISGRRKWLYSAVSEQSREVKNFVFWSCGSISPSLWISRRAYFRGKNFTFGKPPSNGFLGKGRKGCDLIVSCNCCSDWWVCCCFVDDAVCDCRSCCCQVGEDGLLRISLSMGEGLSSICSRVHSALWAAGYLLVVFWSSYVIINI